MEARVLPILRDAGGKRQSRELTSKKVGDTAGGIWNFFSDLFSCSSETRSLKTRGRIRYWKKRR